MVALRKILRIQANFSLRAFVYITSWDTKTQPTLFTPCFL